MPDSSIGPHVAGWEPALLPSPSSHTPDSLLYYTQHIAIPVMYGL